MIYASGKSYTDGHSFAIIRTRLKQYQSTMILASISDLRYIFHSIFETTDKAGLI